MQHTMLYAFKTLGFQGEGMLDGLHHQTPLPAFLPRERMVGTCPMVRWVALCAGRAWLRECRGLYEEYSRFGLQ